MALGTVRPVAAGERASGSWTLGLGIGTGLSLVAGTAVAYWVKAVPYDDPFITFRYAENLRDGLGLVFNPGEQVFAVTTPLLALLLGGLGVLLPGSDVAALGYWVSLIALVAAGAVASALCWREGERAAALLAPFTLMWANSLIYTVGQETSLLLALGLTGFYFWRAGRLRLAALSLALLSLTRPDGILLVLLVLAAELYRGRRIPWSAGLVFAIVLAPWYLYAWSTYGSPLPFSLAAKTAQAGTGWWPTAGAVLPDWLLDNARRWPLTAALTALGLAYAALRARWFLLVFAWPALQVAGYAVMGVAYYTWYFAPLHGILGLFVALGAGAGVSLSRRYAPRWLPAALALFVLLAAGALVPSLQATRAAGAGVPDARMRQYEEIGLWLRQHSEPSRVAAALEMGRLGYFSQRPMFDFVGLVKPPVVDHLRQKDLIWSVKNYRPDFAIAIPPDLWLPQDAWFQNNYAPLRRFVDPAAYGGQPTTVFVRLVGDPPALTPDQTTQYRFGDRIALAGYSVEDRTGRGDSLALTLHWQALQPIDKDYTVFVHALDREGRLVGQLDGPPHGGRVPTSGWQPGETVLDLREITVTSANAVELRVGWYLLETMTRLACVDANGTATDAAAISLGSGS